MSFSGSFLDHSNTQEALVASEQWVVSTLGQDVRPVMSEQDRHLARDLAQGWNSETSFSIS